MYVPPHFRCDDPAVAAELMRAYPLASLISTDDDGLPFVTHLPLHLQQGEPEWVLLGHVAKANPHARYLQARPTALVTFLGPHAYMSPAVYPDPQRVPTWNYLAVHCTVQATLVEAASGKDRLLKHLIADHEPTYAGQWRGLPAAYTDNMLAGIVAFELRVLRWQCKVKLNQHRPESNAALRQRYAAGDAQAQALGVWMDRLGLCHTEAPRPPQSDEAA